MKAGFPGWLLKAGARHQPQPVLRASVQTVHRALRWPGKGGGVHGSRRLRWLGLPERGDWLSICSHMRGLGDTRVVTPKALPSRSPQSERGNTIQLTENRADPFQGRPRPTPGLLLTEASEVQR